MRDPIRIGLVFTYHYVTYRNVARGIRRYAESRPHWLFTSVIPEEQPLRSLRARKPDGVIARVTTENLAHALAAWRCPVVDVATILPARPFPRVGVDNQAVGGLAADHFLELGLRHFGFVGHPHWLFSTEREHGFRRTIEAAGYRVASYHHGTAIRSLDPFGQHWHRDLDRRVDRWLRCLAKPVGILAADDLYGVELTEVCRQAGLRVPEDVALLGVNNDDLLCELARPPLSSVLMPAERVGWEAAALLERLLTGAPAPEPPMLIPPQGVAVRRSSETLAFDDPAVVAAVRFIREHGHLPLRVVDVVNEVSIGRRFLERRFRTVLGRGIGEEIRRVHLERAKRLLAETDLPMKAVARQAGFTGFRYLSVVFRQELGMPPTAYRRRMRGQAEGAVR
jgi:LacI family transcriptional regulator